MSDWQGQVAISTEPHSKETAACLEEAEPNVEEAEPCSEVPVSVKQERGHGEDLRLWQAQDRAKRLKPLIDLTDELARRVLVTHPNWDVQQQMHLQHTGLEISADPQADTTVVECRWAERHPWQGTNAVQICLPIYADFTVIGLPEQFADSPDGSPDLTDKVLTELCAEVRFQVSLLEAWPSGLPPNVPDIDDTELLAWIRGDDDPFESSLDSDEPSKLSFDSDAPFV